MKNSLFRDDALKKLTSPERLNQMVRVTSPKAWLALTGLFIIIGSAILWSIFGEIPHRVTGKGILIVKGGVTEVASIASGRVDKVLFKEGDTIRENEIIAYVEQPELEIQIKNAQQKLTELRDYFNQVGNYDNKDLEMKKSLLKEKQQIQIETIEENKKRLVHVLEQIKNQEELLRKGLITKETLNKTKNLYFSIQQENEKLNNDLSAIQLDIFEKSNTDMLTHAQLKEQILDLEREVTTLETKLLLNSTIRSPYTGRVIETMTNDGDIISAGTPILSLEVSDKGGPSVLEAVIYVLPSSGKLIEEGMPVRVAPSTIRVEEFGFIEGVVSHVSEYPATKKGMTRLLGNQELVNTFFEGGEPPIAVFIRLTQDNTTPSGFKWTSKIGPKTKIRSGTMCSGDFVIDTYAPISLLFPSVK